MIKPFGVLFLLIVLSFCMLGCNQKQDQVKANSKNGDVVGDKLYISDGYKQKLKAMDLIEVAALPYFHSPFIVVAKDNNGNQSAVIFYENGETKTVKLPVKYEEIIKIIKKNGFNINASQNLSNLHLFEIKQNVFWNYEDGDGNIYLDTEGQVVVDPYK